MRLRQMFHPGLPRQVIIQLTEHCNASCPQCGMRASQPGARRRLSLDTARRILDTAAEEGVGIVSLTGGEPFLHFDDVVALLRYAGSLGIPFLRTGTNGFWLSDEPSRVADRIAELASSPVRNFWISLDSAEPRVHEQLRGLPGLIRSLEKNLPRFHAWGLYPAANLGLNRLIGGKETEHLRLEPEPDPAAIAAFYQGYCRAFRGYLNLILDLGFTLVNACYPMGLEEGGQAPVYAAASADAIMDYNRVERQWLLQAWQDTVPEFRGRVRIFSPRVSLQALVRQHAGRTPAPYPCLGGSHFFFISARDHLTYACGYLPDSLGPFWEKRWKTNPPGDCRACDWECFRDPSELLGFARHSWRDPRGWLRRLRSDYPYFRMWLRDLRYFLASDFFDGRKPPRLDRLRAAAEADLFARKAPLCPGGFLQSRKR
ncbi:MAG: radical SAM protein [candidate division FCPU426 bacterium]